MKTPLATLAALALVACSDPDPGGGPAAPPDASSITQARCSAPATRSLSPAGAVAVDLDSASIAWTVDPPQGGPGQLWIVPRQGGDAPVVIETDEHPRGLVLGATQVFWLSHGEGLWSAPRGGGKARQRWHQSGTVGARGVVLDQGRVYWASIGNVLSLPQDAPENTVPERVLEHDVRSLVVDGDLIYATTKRSVLRVKKDGSSEPTALLEGRTSLDAIALHGGKLYVVDTVEPARGLLLEIPAEGGSPRVVASFDAPASPGVAASGDHVYVGGLDALLRAPRAGGQATPFFCGAAGPIAADGATLAWLDPLGERLSVGHP